MIESLIVFIHTYLLPLGSLGVFIASIIEEILAPIPSAMVIFAAGFLLVSGPLSLSSFVTLIVKVSIPATAGIVLGSLFAYFLAYYLGKPVLLKWGKWLGLSWEKIEEMQAKFSKSSFDELSLFVIRAVPIVPSIVISAFCGLVRFPFRAYVIYSFLGLLVRTTILGFFGWQLGKFYFAYAKTINLFENAILIGVAVAVVGYIVWKRVQAKKKVLQSPLQPTK